MANSTTLGRSRSPLLMVICFPVSVHSVRWVEMLRGGPFRTVVFPSVLQDAAVEWGKLPVVKDLADAESLRPGELADYDRSMIESVAASSEYRSKEYKPIPSAVGVPFEAMPSPISLVSAIRRLQPDLVHNLELQHGGYLCLEARRRIGAGFPLWLASSWGSDVFLYRKIKRHAAVLRELFGFLDVFHADCERDYHVAEEEFAFKGSFFPLVSATGGQNLQDLPQPSALPPPSKRKVIVVKGYHGWSGRGLHILLALHRIAPQLRNFQIRVTHGVPAVATMVEALAKEDGLDIVLDPYYPDHATALARLAEARVVVGCGISDGISTTLLEAMVMGAFCIQADTACGCEWIEPGVGGLIVPPHDTVAIAAAVVRAITDDELVDNAAIVNRKVVERRWNTAVNGPIVCEAYQDLLRKAAVKS